MGNPMKKVYVLILFVLSSISLTAETLTLDKCIELGLKNSFTIFDQEIKLKKSKQSLLSTYYDFIPNISSNVKYNEMHNSLDNISKTAELSISEYIYSNDSRYFNIRRNTSALKQNRINYQLQKRQFIIQVLNYYLNVLQEQKLVEIKKKNLALSEKQLAMTELLYNLNKIAKLDLDRAKLDVSTTKLGILMQKKKLESTKLDLLQLIGLDLHTEYTLDTLTYRFTEYKKTQYTPGLSITFEKEQLFQDKLNYWQRKLELYPTLALSISKRFTWDLEETKYFSDYDDTWNFSAEVSYPILSLFTRNPEVKNAKYQYISQQRNLENLLSSENIKFQKALLDYQNSKEQLALLKEQVKLEKMHLEFIEQKYKLGMIDIIKLEEARNKYIDAQYNEIDGYYKLIKLNEELNLISDEKILGKY